MTPMITVKLKGGLGNQMFQYALGRNLSIKNKTTLIVDTFSFIKNKNRKFELDKYNTRFRVLTLYEKIIIYILNKVSQYRLFSNIHKCVKEEKKYFDKKILSLKGNLYLDGYWQSEKYFQEIRHILLKEFNLKHKIVKKNKKFLKMIKKSNSVCLHIRRGDYVSNARARARYGICSLEYYYKAIEEIKRKIDKPVFFIFSDDIEWARNNLQIQSKSFFLDVNGSDKGYEDLRLMKNCKYFIIANSSFSWWAAWLSTEPEKIVYAPSMWFNKDVVNYSISDIIPKKWVLLR